MKSRGEDCSTGAGWARRVVRRMGLVAAGRESSAERVLSARRRGEGATRRGARSNVGVGAGGGGSG